MSLDLPLVGNAALRQPIDIERGWSHDGNESARWVDIRMKLARNQQIRAAIPFKALLSAPRVDHKDRLSVGFLIGPRAHCGCSILLDLPS